MTVDCLEGIMCELPQPLDALQPRCLRISSRLFGDTVRTSLGIPAKDLDSTSPASESHLSTLGPPRSASACVLRMIEPLSRDVSIERPYWDTLKRVLSCLDAS
ncbi:hypothetical protein BKA56DRAFT_691125 [Ilyonectria sp. MPI-CAGE-AT-0026]|nr:hypothetical protein BKA56DRAFT_691125 [Ilyonectria sp. MPI-CAGE-AT-0026]